MYRGSEYYCYPISKICKSGASGKFMLRASHTWLHIYMYLMVCVWGGEGGLANGDFSHLTDGENTQHAVHLSVDVTCRL